MAHTASVLLNRLLARGKFRHVQVLLKVSELGSLQRTAEAIGMTQSSVTQTLAYLERLLELPLFERHARGMRPTQACNDLLPVARQVLHGIAAGAEALAARQGHGQGVVRLATSVSAAHGLLIDQLPRFGERHPGVRVHLVEAEGDDQLLAIARGEVDLVACRRPPVVPQGWLFQPLIDDRLAVLCRAAHPLASAIRAKWKDLHRWTWLLAPTGTSVRKRFDDLATAFPHPPRAHTVVTRSPTTLSWLLLREDLLAFVPLQSMRPLIDAGSVCEVDVRPASAIEPLGLLRPEGAMTEAAQALADFLSARVRAADLNRGRRRGERRAGAV